MPYDSFKHHRRSIRLKGYDYSQPGAYFVTMVTHGRMHLFGEIVDGVMRLNDFGEIAQAEWLKTPSIRPEIALDEFQIMPNHFHAIVMIMDYGNPIGAHGNAPESIDGASVGAHGNAPCSTHGNAPRPAHGNAPDPAHSNLPSAPSVIGGDSIRAHCRAPLHRLSRSLATLIGGYKTIVTIRVNEIRRAPGAKLWLRNYHDHIIRNEDELSRIRKYIRNNPLRWDNDKENQ